MSKKAPDWSLLLPKSISPKLTKGRRLNGKSTNELAPRLLGAAMYPAKSDLHQRPSDLLAIIWEQVIIRARPTTIKSSKPHNQSDGSGART